MVKKKPKFIGLGITEACNLNCKTCLLGKKSKKYLSLKTLSIILPKIKKQGYSYLGITGGEACLHPQFEELIALIVKHNLSFHITSNGFSLDSYKFLAQKYKKELGSINFSLDGANSQTNDFLRGKHSYARATQSIKYFSNEKIKTIVNFCVNKKNLSQLAEMFNLTIKLGASGIKFIRMIDNSSNHRLGLTNLEKEYLNNKISQLEKNTSLSVLKTSSLQKNTKNYCSGLDLDFSIINPWGDLLFCCDTNRKNARIGSLKNESFSQLIKKGRKMRNYILQKRKLMRKKNYAACEFCNKCLADYKKENLL